MILQFDLGDYGWIMGLAIMFGLAFFLNVITFKKMPSFFVYLTMFNAFMVWAGLLDFWTLILCIMILTLILIFQLKSQADSDQ